MCVNFRQGVQVVEEQLSQGFRNNKFRSQSTQKLQTPNHNELN